ncbi:hypothetical protein VTH82DRAFT_5384 [Thermothelomyces myriococcoides]
MAAVNGAVAANISEGDSTANRQKSGVAAGDRQSPPKPALHQIYALPAPIRTFPLPAFYPNNPISLLHLVYAWLSHVLRPPPREPSVIHIGVWDPETRSVHVIDESSVRALWEQGFYGKGSLSRSEPNWLKRELARRGSPEGKTVSEARTEMRREERRLAKWERAKAELEAIERQRLAEAASQVTGSELSKSVAEISMPAERADTSAQSAFSTGVEPVSTAEETSAEIVPAELVHAEAVRPPCTGAQPASHDRHWDFRPPVGPAELLALPNSLPKPKSPENGTIPDLPRNDLDELKPPVGPAELLTLPNSNAELVALLSKPAGRLAVSEPETGVPGQSVSQVALDLSNHAKTLDSQPSINGIVDEVVSKASASVADQDVDEMSTNGAAENESTEPRSSSPSMFSDAPASVASVPGLESNVSTPQKRRKSSGTIGWSSVEKRLNNP